MQFTKFSEARLLTPIEALWPEPARWAGQRIPRKVLELTPPRAAGIDRPATMEDA
jgi:hypothetical protein